MEPTNIRLLYILVGGILMVSAILWLRSLKEAVEEDATATSCSFCAWSRTA
jgi:hypothetical protein